MHETDHHYGESIDVEGGVVASVQTMQIGTGKGLQWTHLGSKP